MKHWLQKPIALPIIVVIGIGLFLLVTKSRQAPDAQSQDEYATPAYVLNLKPESVTPRVTGYGSVNPASNLNVPAEVAGGIKWVHAGLKKGAELKAGTKVIQLDKRDYQLTLSKAKADRERIKTQLAELNLEESNTKRQLELAQKKLDLASSEFKRKKELADQGALSKSQLEAEEQVLINMRTELQNLELKLDLHPKQRDLLKAESSVAQATIEEQARNLERTTIYMPFDARIGQVNVDKGAFVATGSTLFIAQGKKRVEIEAQISMPSMLPLIQHIRGKDLNQLSAKERLSALNIKANVQMVGAPETANWPAKVLRTSDSIDPQTRTMSIVVAIDEADKKAITGQRPPLLKGMYMAVTLSSDAMEGWKIPRSAIHENRLYYLDDENRLRIREARVLFKVDDYAILTDKPAFKRLVISDIIPAVDGMLIAPHDSKTIRDSENSETEKQSS